MPNNFLEWVAWAGLVVPLCVLAWSAYRFVNEIKEKREADEFSRVFKVMDHLGQQGGSVASKMAAAYELRKFARYKSVIIRLCDSVKIDGTSAKMLREELKLTRDYLSKK